MHEGEDAAADALGRIFAGVGEGQRLFGAKAEAGDETRGGEPKSLSAPIAPRMVKTPNSSRLNW